MPLHCSCSLSIVVSLPQKNSPTEAPPPHSPALQNSWPFFEEISLAVRLSGVPWALFPRPVQVKCPEPELCFPLLCQGLVPWALFPVLCQGLIPWALFPILCQGLIPWALFPVLCQGLVPWALFPVLCQGLLPWALFPGSNNTSNYPSSH